MNLTHLLFLAACLFDLHSSAANITDPLAAHGHGGVTKKKITFDESRLVKQKFKTAPATQAEMKDCEVALTPVKLQVIQVHFRFSHENKHRNSEMFNKSCDIYWYCVFLFTSVETKNKKCSIY
jgi:hypothetical protein